MTEHVIGIDIGATSIKGGLVDSNGRISFQGTEPNSNLSDKELCSRVCKLVKQINNESKSNQKLPVGIGSPGPLNGNSGLVYKSANMPKLKAANIFGTLKKEGYEQLKLENDANCAALGSLIFGSGKNYANFAVITLGTGIGGGLILEKKLFSGWEHNGFEIGHIPIYTENKAARSCGCGKVGCLETIASAVGISQSFFEQRQTRKSPSEIAQLAAQGDQAALEVFAFASKSLGLAVASIVQLLNLEAIIFTGGIAKASHLLLPIIEKTFHAHTQPNLRDRVKILFSEQDSSSGVTGAAAQHFSPALT